MSGINLLSVVVACVGLCGPPPPAPTRPPAVVLLSGGAYVSVTPDAMADEAAAFTAAGYKAVAPAYTIANPGEAIADVRAVVRSLQREGRRVVVWGESAGGTLAEAVAAEGTADAAVVAAGPTNLVTWRAPDGEYFGTDAFWDEMAPPATVADRAAWSPVNQITGRSAPMLIFHSRNDHLVGLDQATDFVARLRKRDRPVTFVSMGDADHSFGPAFQARAFAWVRRQLPLAL